MLVKKTKKSVYVFWSVNVCKEIKKEPREILGWEISL